MHLLENLNTTSEFRLKIKSLSKGKTKVAKMASILDDEIEDQLSFYDDLLYNYIDVTNKNDVVTFLPDSKASGLDSDFTKKGRSEIKIGRLIRYLFDIINPPLDISDKDYEDFVNAYKATKNDDRRFELVSGDDIPIYYKKGGDYGSLGSSCMNDKPKKLFNLYKNNDNIKLLALIDSNGNLTGRALIWKLYDSKFEYFMDRVYTTYDYDVYKFIEYAKKK